MDVVDADAAFEKTVARNVAEHRRGLDLVRVICGAANNQLASNAIGDEVSAAYLKLKTNEWNAYCRHLTQWERDTTLDC